LEVCSGISLLIATSKVVETCIQDTIIQAVHTRLNRSQPVNYRPSAHRNPSSSDTSIIPNTTFDGSTRNQARYSEINRRSSSKSPFQDTSGLTLSFQTI
jgi:hypothetical protein